MNKRYDDFMLGGGNPTPPKVSNRPPSSPIPDYTEHLRARQEAAIKYREGFENRVGPTIHVQLQVRHVVAENYEDAKSIAYDRLAADAMTNDMVNALMRDMLDQEAERVDNPWRYAFLKACRVAKECDGTYTVTLP